MKLEDKIDKFYTSSIDSAHKKAADIVCAHQEALYKLLEEHKESKRRQAALEIADARTGLQKEKNKALSAEQLNIKRHQSMEIENLKEKLFVIVSDKLTAFKERPEYIDLLEEKIREVSAYAAGSDVDIYLDPSDDDILEELIKRTGADIKISKEGFIGGIRAILPERHILIDHTFSSAFAEAREGFAFRGGKA